MAGGRPRIDIDWMLLESLAAWEATEEYIACQLIKKDGAEENYNSIQAKIRLMQRRVRERYKCSFVQYRDQKLESKRANLRKLQWQAAQKGNVAMLIWLGKQYLGQVDREKLEHALNKENGIKVVVQDYTVPEMTVVPKLEGA